MRSCAFLLWHEILAKTAVGKFPGGGVVFGCSRYDRVLLALSFCGDERRNFVFPPRQVLRRLATLFQVPAHERGLNRRIHLRPCLAAAEDTVQTESRARPNRADNSPPLALGARRRETGRAMRPGRRGTMACPRGLRFAAGSAGGSVNFVGPRFWQGGSGLVLFSSVVPRRTHAGDRIDCNVIARQAREFLRRSASLRFMRDGHRKGFLDHG